MSIKFNKSTKFWELNFYYTDENGIKHRKRKKNFLTKKEAKAFEENFLKEIKRKIEDLKKIKKIELTFEDLTKYYLEYCKSRLKATTYDTKVYIFRKKIINYFKNIKISEINSHTILEWQNMILNPENNFSETYIRTINNQLSAIFNFAVRHYQLPNNPVRIAGCIGKKRAGEVKFWTKKEFDTFLNGIKNKFESEVMFSILFYTGIRVGELLALTLDDFDFDKKNLRINKSYSRLKGKDLIQEPKTPKAIRDIALDKKLCNLVKKFANSRYDYKSNERLFPLTKHFLHHEMKRGCQKTGVKKIRIHDLRHSHASLLIEIGCDINSIANRLGHTDIQTTLQTYAHLYPNKQEEIIKKLENLY